MSLNVEKEAATVLNVVKKNGFEGKQFTVDVVLDVSGSARNLYRTNGEISNILQRCISLGGVVDPTASVNVSAFASESKVLGSLQLNDFANALSTFLGRADDILWGGTDYAEAIRALNRDIKKRPTLGVVTGFFKGLFGKPQPARDIPRLVLFVSDGQDAGSREDLEKELATLIDGGDVFVIMLGIGSKRDFRLMEEIDDVFFGVAHVHVQNATMIDNDGFYSLLLNDEFKQWMAGRV